MTLLSHAQVRFLHTPRGCSARISSGDPMRRSDVQCARTINRPAPRRSVDWSAPPLARFRLCTPCCIPPQLACIRPHFTFVPAQERRCSHGQVSACPEVVGLVAETVTRENATRPQACDVAAIPTGQRSVQPLHRLARARLELRPGVRALTIFPEGRRMSEGSMDRQEKENKANGTTGANKGGGSNSN